MEESDGEEAETEGLDGSDIALSAFCLFVLTAFVTRIQ